MEMMPIFGALGSIMGAFGGGDEPAPTPAPVAQKQTVEREKAPTIAPEAKSAAMKQREAVAAKRATEAKAGTSTTNTRGGVSIVGG